MPRSTRSLNQREQDALRQRGIAMVQAGASQAAVARGLGVRPATVCAWMRLARHGAKRSTRSRRRGPRTSPHRKLKPWQARRIASHLANKEPLQLRLSYPVWTPQVVAELIKDLYRVELSRWAVHRYLRQWGFMPQAPVPLRQHTRNATAFAEVQAAAKRESAVIWMQCQAGKRPDELVQVLFASTPRGRCAFSVYAGTLTPTVFLRFVQQICESERRKVYLVIDGHPIHRSRLLIQWAAANPHRLRLVHIHGFAGASVSP